MLKQTIKKHESAIHLAKYHGIPEQALDEMIVICYRFAARPMENDSLESAETMTTLKHCLAIDRNIMEAFQQTLSALDGFLRSSLIFSNRAVIALK